MCRWQSFPSGFTEPRRITPLLNFCVARDSCVSHPPTRCRRCHLLHGAPFFDSSPEAPEEPFRKAGGGGIFHTERKTRIDLGGLKVPSFFLGWRMWERKGSSRAEYVKGDWRGLPACLPARDPFCPPTEGVKFLLSSS